MDKVLEARGLTIDEYLKISYGIMKIPYTQRPYEWGKSQILRLFDDFCNVYESKVEQHILNFITLYKEKEYFNIYDGQQRTVSIFIIMCALLNYLKEIPSYDPEFVEGIKRDYIVTKNYRRTKEIQYKLNFEDDETNSFFRKYIIDGEIIGDTNLLSQQDKALMTNYDEIMSEIKKYFFEERDPIIIQSFINSILDKVLVIVLETSDKDIANQMFETLNNTGKKIAEFYVLKNQLVRILGEEQVKNEWDEIENNLDGLSKNKFLVAYASTFYGKTSESGVYKAIESSNKISNEKEAALTLKEIKRASEMFLHLSMPRLRQDPDNIELNKFDSIVNTLKMVSANQYKPVIISMELKQYSLGDINKVLKSLLNLHIRNIFISQDLPGTLEKFYPTLAQNIYKNNIKVEEVIQEIQGKMNKGTTLKRSFLDRIIKSNTEKKVIRYILKEIYDYENSGEVKVVDNAQQVNLEHILPQSPAPNSNWLQIFNNEEEREIYKNSIGNLTILLGTKNSSGGNHDFDRKKVIYEKSAIVHNRKIAKLNKWDKKAIEKRAEQLYEIFIKVW